MEWEVTLLFPICFAAAILKIKFIIYENNLVLGKANKYLLPFTSKYLFPIKRLKVFLIDTKKIFVIGNIIRKEIINLDLKGDDKEKYKNMNILVLE